MSFNQHQQGTSYAPGWFLKNAECVRETRTIPQNHAQVVTAANGGKYVPAGAFFPANSSGTVEGILYEDVDVTSGDMPGSVVTSGEVYTDRLPAAPESGVQSALEGKGFKFTAAVPPVVRPADGATLAALAVTSVAGSASGKTKITVSGVSLSPGDGYKYKTHASTAPSVTVGEVLGDGWTSWDGSADITATTGHKITVAVVNAGGAAIAAGSADVTSKA